MDTARSLKSDASDQLLEAMPDAIVMVSMDGRVARVNARAEKLSGYSRGELTGMPVEELVPASLRSGHVAHRIAYQAHPAIRPMSTHLDIRFRRKDGSEFPADIALSPVTTAAGTLIVASIRDTTERHRAEEELQQAQERLRLVVDAVQDYAIVMLDPEGRVSTWSPGATRLEGYEAHEIVGRDLSVLYTPADLKAGKPARELATAAGVGRYEEEGWRVRKDGSRFWANVVVTPIRDQAGKLLGFAKITRDVTSRKRQDDRLRAVVEVAQATLEGRAEQDLLRLIADRARALTEAGRGAIELLDEGGLTASAAVVDGSTGGTPGPEATLTVRLSSGNRIIGRLSVTDGPGGGFTDADRQLLELFAAQAAVAIDYTRVRDDLQRLAVLEDRERIGRDLHDGAIQALFAVGMSLQAMAIGLTDKGLQDRLETTVGQIDDVIRDLRNYIFGLRPGLAADRQLGRALHELAEQMERQHGVVCAVDVDQAVAARLSGMSADVVQVAREALSNVGRHAHAATCRLSLCARGGAAVLAIEDDGRGFAPDGAGGGWGLRNLGERAASMGGSLDVESAAGEGTTVRVTIPIGVPTTT